MCKDADKPALATQSDDRNGCGGAVETPQWYIAVVRHNTEKAARDKLLAIGYEAYVATQTEEHLYKCGHKKQIEKVIIPTYVFIRATNQQRIQALKDCPLLSFYVLNPASGKGTPIKGNRPLAVIPDDQMRQLQYMLFHAPSPVDFTPRMKKGDPIRVARGPLKGFQGTFIAERTHTSVAVVIDVLGTASVQIPKEDILPLQLMSN